MKKFLNQSYNTILYINLRIKLFYILPLKHKMYHILIYPVNSVFDFI